MIRPRWQRFNRSGPLLVWRRWDQAIALIAALNLVVVLKKIGQMLYIVVLNKLECCIGYEKLAKMQLFMHTWNKEHHYKLLHLTQIEHLTKKLII